MSHSSLPKFDNPPVIEVALSVMFEPVEGYSTARAGRLWNRYPGFPQTQDHPELDLAFEEPSVPAASEAQVMFETVPRIRTWFLSGDGTKLIQVQRNRFIYNWRRAETDAPYPSYDAVRAEFVDSFNVFVDFLAAEGFSAPKVTGCDVTYVNQIRRGPDPHGRVGQVIRLWNDLGDEGGFLPSPGDARFITRYVIPEPAGAGMLGRLTVSLQPAFLKKTGAEILTLTMLARGKPLSPDLDGALRFLDIGHEWIVRGFKELTTPEMHRDWRLRT